MLTSLTLILSYLANKLTPFHIMAKERTFIAVKPDGVQRGLIGDIIKRFETKGFKLVAMKFVQASEDHLKKHYSDLADKPFFAGLVKYMASAPLLAMCWEGTNVVKTARKMMGETKPADSLPGTIRGDYCIEVGRNIIHGSDSVESAEKEIALWFKSEELVNWTSASQAWIYEWTSKLGLIKDERGLDHLNNYLEDKSYIDGYVLSLSDFELHSKIVIHINDKKHPHVFRWFNHIANLNLENKQITNLSFTDKVTNFKVESKEKLTSENKVKKDFKIEYKEKVTLDSNDKEKVILDSTYKEKVNFDSNYREKTNLNSVETKKTDLKSDKKSTKSEKPSKRTSKTEKRKEPKSKPHQQKEKESVSVKEIKNIEIKEMDEYNELTLIESKYNIVLEVRAKDEETNMTELEHLVRGITLDGLKWGNSQLISISYGTSKLSIICTFENNKSSVHDVMQTIMKLEDYVKTVDIAAFNKF